MVEKQCSLVFSYFFGRAGLLAGASFLSFGFGGVLSIRCKTLSPFSLSVSDMAFNLKLSEYYIMIGAISCEWNDIEHNYRDIIKTIFSQNQKLAEFLYKNLGNQTRWELISRECKNNFPPGYVDYIDYFLKCAAICNENRNFLIHSKFELTASDEVRGFKDNKSITKDDWVFRIEKTDLTEIANEIIAVAKYGKILNVNLLINFTPVNWEGGPNIKQEATQIAAQMHEALERKPPQPRKIDQRIHRLN